ncbi:MAG TPA: hypothetical protein VK707_04495 [Solirubrobacteraceae bacterium]|jgi:hypothetical protein|nr:hypothetical protein [Solirubrobacteraceae bacterium]
MTLARAIGVSTATLATAATLAACGSSSSPTPVQVGERWYRATAQADGSKLCKLSTAARQRRFIDLGQHLPGGSGVTTCAAAVDLTLKHFGGSARLGKLADVHIHLVSQSKEAAEVQAEKAAPLKLIRSGSTWLVSEAGRG